jgi:DNA-binding MarR family transcriptional regulator
MAEREQEEKGVAALDLASRLTHEHHQSLKVWLRMLSCTVRIENEIRSRLRSTFGITLPRFDLMAQLERHPDGLRMGELSKRMMVTGGNITGITDQLEQEKLVVRVPDPKDRRAYAVKLTEKGRQVFGEIAVVHERWIEELLKDVSFDDKGKLIELLSQMKRHLDAGGEQA